MGIQEREPLDPQGRPLLQTVEQAPGFGDSPFHEPAAEQAQEEAVRRAGFPHRSGEEFGRDPAGRLEEAAPLAEAMELQQEGGQGLAPEGPNPDLLRPDERRSIGPGRAEGQPEVGDAPIIPIDALDQRAGLLLPAEGDERFDEIRSGSSIGAGRGQHPEGRLPALEEQGEEGRVLEPARDP